MIAGRHNLEIDVIQWHFFPDKTGVFGPDSGLLDELIRLGIPYKVYLP